MALTLAGGSSIFGNTKGKVITPMYTFKADGDIAISKGATQDFKASDIYGYDKSDSKKAQYKLGFITEDLQEEIRAEAYGDYPKYLKEKKERLMGVRAEAINAYGQQVTRLKALGIDEEVAEKKAVEHAKMIYNSLMEQFRILYPQEGTKVKPQF